MSKTTILEVYQDRKGIYRFRLLSREGKLICSSEKFEKKAAAMLQAKKLSEWVSKAVLVDADKKADAASKTTGKQPVAQKGKQVANKAAKSKVTTKKTATKQVVPVEA
jgi:CRISPR/Cas system CSM-associated protein Csm4 (group 5 of RAMP superfamily)